MEMCDNEADKRRLRMKSFYDAIKKEKPDHPTGNPAFQPVSTT
jgi:hypothetical protein